VNGPELRRLFRRVLANAAAREDEAAGSRCMRVEIEGVDCAATFKVRLAVRISNGVRRIDGECMAYLSCIESDTLASGFGWLRFGIAARSASNGEALESLFEWALEDARAELVLRPEFVALRERSAMSASVTPPPSSRLARAKSL
jgi:hypothetical protein